MTTGIHLRQVSRIHCWYCGEEIELSNADEHVFPQSLGGNANYVGDRPNPWITREVCEPCNARSQKVVDTPVARFSRLANARPIFGVKNNGKLPAMPSGRLKWGELRDGETVDVQEAMGSVHIVVTRLADGSRYADAFSPDSTAIPLEILARLYGEDKPSLMTGDSRAKELCSKLSVIYSGPSSTEVTRKDYEWAEERLVLKLALGACCALWPDFVTSEAARQMRKHIFESGDAALGFVRSIARDRGFFAFGFSNWDGKAVFPHTIRLSNRGGCVSFYVRLFASETFEYWIDPVATIFAQSVDWEWKIDPHSKSTTGRMRLGCAAASQCDCGSGSRFDNCHGRIRSGNFRARPRLQRMIKLSHKLLESKSD